MADTYSQERRSEIMSRITSRNTKPEIRVRSLLHQMGFRFRLHRKDLPGKPDIVLPKWNTVVLVHGCFWHGHDCCDGHIPKSNTTYWSSKLARNRQRDKENSAKLIMLGWKLIVVWECQTGNVEKLRSRLLEAFGLTVNADSNFGNCSVEGQRP